MQIEYALQKLGEAVSLAQLNASELEQIRSNLLVRFGPTSLSLEWYGFEYPTEGTENKDSTMTILLFVLDKLIERGGVPTI